jgi:hypothetical protein
MRKFKHKVVISDWYDGELTVIEVIAETYEVALDLAKAYHGYIKIYNEYGEIVYAKHHEHGHHPYVPHHEPYA